MLFNSGPTDVQLMLVDFTMTCHSLFSNHVTVVANVEKLKICPVYDQNFEGGGGGVVDAEGVAVKDA